MTGGHSTALLESLGSNLSCVGRVLRADPRDSDRADTRENSHLKYLDFYETDEILCLWILNTSVRIYLIYLRISNFVEKTNKWQVLTAISVMYLYSIFSMTESCFLRANSIGRYIHLFLLTRKSQIKNVLCWKIPELYVNLRKTKISRLS